MVPNFKWDTPKMQKRRHTKSDMFTDTGRHTILNKRERSDVQVWRARRLDKVDKLERRASPKKHHREIREHLNRYPYLKQR